MCSFMEIKFTGVAGFSRLNYECRPEAEVGNTQSVTS